MPDAVFGHQYVSDLGELVLLLDFESASALTVTVLEGGGIAVAGQRERVDVTMAEVRPGLYFTTWQNRAGATVTQMQDFVNAMVRATLALPDGRCLVMTGSLRRTDDTEPSPGAGTTVRKQIARQAMRELLAGRIADLDRYWTPGHRDHALPADGHEGLRAFAMSAVGRRWEPVRMIAEGDMVVAHGRLTADGAPSIIVVDLFRFEGNRIAEHWNVAQPDSAEGDRPML
ncbi:nuclear transport factor 2 family protein [Actinoplanes palleronii]|uniref:SnoaL-like domain-containing protein n=1 Tax=Actinoplanes palleronii TaxID=113570 RepID=A0ABQ4BFR0_9ACTN|nr:nuclear transport factor 2 family protein [Actinoplanes palleronii]GIE69504.1 hypothetical protein Apa02nite_056120 [Actinoplanes palleronii]